MQVLSINRMLSQAYNQARCIQDLRTEIEQLKKENTSLKEQLDRAISGLNETESELERTKLMQTLLKETILKMSKENIWLKSKLGAIVDESK